MKKFTRQSLARLQASNLPHCKAADLFSVKEGVDPEIAKATMDRLDEYLQCFTLMEKGMCVCCGAQQGGSDLADFMLGKPKFRWGLTHGEGFCSECGYPGRAMHYIGKGEEEIIIRNLILQYHPSGLSFDKPMSVERTATTH